MTDTPMLEVRALRKEYRQNSENSLFARTFTAVENVGFQVRRGETFGIVGESGCGKSTLARLIMALEKPTAGEIYFQGQRIDTMPERTLRPLRPRFQMVFQDSGSSLNPRKRVREILVEPMRRHGIGDRRQAEERAAELMTMVGLPVEMLGRYPHEFSGGQRQRVCIARALSLNPDLIVLDEPVSALDVSVQAQILNLLRDLQERLGITYVFIGHGLGAVRYISRRIAVMYMGRIVETGEAEEVFARPAHPYTRALLDAAPSADYAQRGRRRSVLKGEAEGQTPQGACPLYPRCPLADGECLRHSGELMQTPGREGHVSECLRAWEG